MNFLLVELINRSNLNINHRIIKSIRNIKSNIYLHTFLIVSVVKIKIIKSISILNHQISKSSTYQIFRKFFEKSFFTIYFIIQSKTSFQRFQKIMLFEHQNFDRKNIIF